MPARREADHRLDKRAGDGLVASLARQGRTPANPSLISGPRPRRPHAAALDGATLSIGSAVWLSSLWLFLVGVGSGMFSSPNTAAMTGTVAPHPRGVAAGTRTMLQNTGAVVSIALVLAIVTAAVPKPVLFTIFSGLATGLSDRTLAPFVHNMHTALWVLAATSVLGARVSLLRPRHASYGIAQRTPRPAANRGRPAIEEATR